MRNEKILNSDPNLRKVSEWINENKKLFRRPVHGPIVCKVTTTDAEISNCLENHVKNSVLKSFVVECREDMTLLYNEVRKKRNMRINIHIVDQGRLNPVKRIYSDEKMHILKREHDVRGYLDEFFEAPPPILQALRSTSNVQSVLIGGQRTKNNLDNQGLQDYLFEREDGNGKQKFCVFAKETGARRRLYKVGLLVPNFMLIYENRFLLHGSYHCFYSTLPQFQDTIPPRHLFRLMKSARRGCSPRECHQQKRREPKMQYKHHRQSLIACSQKLTLRKRLMMKRKGRHKRRAQISKTQSREGSIM